MSGENTNSASPPGLEPGSGPASRETLARILRALRRQAPLLAVAAAGLAALMLVDQHRVAVAAAAFLALLVAALWPALTQRRGARPLRARPHSGQDAALRALIGAQADPVVVTDRGGHVVLLNPAAEAMSPALRRGAPVTYAIRAPEFVDVVKRATEDDQTVTIELAERVPVERQLKVIATPFRLRGPADGAHDHVLYAFQDLSATRRVERMRADFVANASHELRTPLASLLAFIETLQGAARDDKVARERFLGVMADQARRMTRLIDDLLSLSRIELDEHLPPAGRVDLKGVVESVTSALGPLAAERGVEIAVEAEPGPLTVIGDRDALIRLAENLVENALKYGANGKRVDIRLKPDEATMTATLTVADHGPGIAAEHLPRLTERFYRVDVARSRAEGGTGLGLAIVKHIVARHRGRLVVTSTIGEGATFTVTLPLASRAARQKSDIS